MKNIIFSKHSLEQLIDRGTNKEEIIISIQSGERLQAKKGRVSYRKNFPFDALWKNKHYRFKQVMPIVKEDDDRYIVITVYVYYF